MVVQYIYYLIMLGSPHFFVKILLVVVLLETFFAILEVLTRKSELDIRQLRLYLLNISDRLR